MVLLMSRGSNRSTSGGASVRKPRATGLKATKPTPSSAQASSTATSGLRVHSEYSDCTAAIGWTAFARRRVSAETSDRPMARTIPAATRSARPPTASSIGVSLSQRCR